jgi:hypothetical protein
MLLEKYSQAGSRFRLQRAVHSRKKNPLTADWLDSALGNDSQLGICIARFSSDCTLKTTGRTQQGQATNRSVLRPEQPPENAVRGHRGASAGSHRAH